MEIYKIPVVLSDEDKLFLTYLENLKKQSKQPGTGVGLLAAVIDSNISKLLKEEIKEQELKNKILQSVSITKG